MPTRHWTWSIYRERPAGCVAAGPWGWKLCEVGYILPFLDFLFPDARFIYLVRDGRDVAFCDHVAPHKPFWRKIYFNTDRIECWRGRPLDNRAYDRRRHVYNALHWRNSVEVGRAYGAMLRQRCREVRYEALCTDFPGTMTELLAFAGVAANPAAIAAAAATVHRRSIGKHRDQSWLRRRQVQALIAPTLASFGYVQNFSAILALYREILAARRCGSAVPRLAAGGH